MKALGKPDLSLQARVNHLDMTHVHRLSAILESQNVLAPVIIFCDKKGKLWLADGFHRHECYRKARKEAIPAYQIEGERLEAIEFATMCNRHTCLGRTREDIRKAIYMVFEMSQWFNRADEWIAVHIGCGAGTVSRARYDFCKSRSRPIPERLETQLGNRVASRRPLDIPIQTESGSFQLELNIGGRNAVVFGDTFEEVMKQVRSKKKELEDQEFREYKAEKKNRKPCPTCGGKPCPTCDGLGWIHQENERSTVSTSDV